MITERLTETQRQRLVRMVTHSLARARGIPSEKAEAEAWAELLRLLSGVDTVVSVERAYLAYYPTDPPGLLSVQSSAANGNGSIA